MSEKFIDTYKELKSFKPPTSRDKARHFALNIAAGLSDQFSQRDQLFKRPRIQFIYLHHVFKDEEGNLDVLLKYLSKSHTFISFSKAIEKICQGEIDRPYIAFSSDDGLKNNIIAAEILSRYDATACFFICPDMIGETNFTLIRKFCNDQLHFPPVEFMNWDEVERLKSQGHEIGGHTMGHVKLSSVPFETGSAEIHNCYQVLTKRFNGPLHFAYPYGRYFHFPANLKPVVYTAGFETCSSAERGCHISNGEVIAPEKLLIRRDHVILDWPLQHILYFLAKNIQRANVENNYYPF
jgi:peptidoglycan/xylan/chitin deacetylase (PgdA/CDA1 family)